jgi:hypothetical protein
MASVRNKSTRNAKENHFRPQNVTKKHGMCHESLVKQPPQPEADRYSMDFFYDIDQSCVDQLKEFLHQKTGNGTCLKSIVV